MNLADKHPAAIRTHPKPGIIFRDITTLLGDARAFRRAVDELVQPLGRPEDRARSPVSRREASSSAARWRISFPPASFRCARRASCRETAARMAYTLEYGLDDDRDPSWMPYSQGERVLLVDDLVATGGTAEAAVKPADPARGRGGRGLLHRRPAGSRRG